MRSIHYSVADNYVFGNLNVSSKVNKFCIILITANVHISEYINILLKTAGVNIESDIDDRTENVYDEAHQGDEDDETVNVYSVSEPQCYHREKQASDNDTYSHLHQRPLQMSDDVYGVPSSILDPSSPKSEENNVS